MFKNHQKAKPTALAPLLRLTCINYSGAAPYPPTLTPCPAAQPKQQKNSIALQFGNLAANESSQGASNVLWSAIIKIYF